jgi:putative transposase
VLLSFRYTVVSVLLDRVVLRTPSARAQTIELLALRHEVRVLRRQVQRRRWQPGDRLFLTALSRCLPRAEWWRLPVRPETLLRWHRDLIRRKWAAFGQRRGPGRPPLAPGVRVLILRLARENPRWGYVRIRGELLKLGHTDAGSTIQALLRRHRVPPAPRRAGLTWPAFLRAHAAALLACDFFTVETVRLQTLYVLFFLEVHPRRVFMTGSAACSTSTNVPPRERLDFRTPQPHSTRSYSYLLVSSVVVTAPRHWSAPGRHVRALAGHISLRQARAKQGAGGSSSVSTLGTYRMASPVPLPS